jgi:cell division protease FtsH
MGHEADYSGEVASVVDAEVRRFIETAHDRARSILSTHRATLDLLATKLVEKETLEDADLAEIFGPLDKGTGIETPDPVATDEPAPIAPELVGAGAGAVVLETAPAAERAPGAGAEPAAARRRWWRRRVSAPSPRPSGT